jgi:hypothetical protein
LSDEREKRLGIVAKNLFSTQPPARTEHERAPTIEPKNDSQIWSDVLRIAKEQPRVSFVSPKVKAILTYLRKTTPEFNVSKVTATLVEEAVSKRWPDLWKQVA